MLAFVHSALICAGVLVLVAVAAFVWRWVVIRKLTGFPQQ